MERRAIVIVLFLATSACGGGPEGADAGVRLDAGEDAGVGMGPTSDGGPPDDTDAGLAVDGGLAMDAGRLSDGGPPTDAGLPVGRCEPTGGARVFEGTVISCAASEIAVMGGIAAPHLEILGDIQIVGRDRSDCVAVDSARIVAPDGRLVVDLGASPGREGSPFGPPLAEGPMAAEVAAVCGESERFDRFRVELAGRVDGGTFTVTCGSTDAPGTFWPPRTMVSCHQGIGRVPGDLSAHEIFPGINEFRVSFPLVPGQPIPETITGSSQKLYLQQSLSFADRHRVMVLPGPSFDRSLAAPITLGGVPAQELQLTSESMDCELFDGRDIHLVRLEGTTDSGAFSTETRLGCP